MVTREQYEKSEIEINKALVNLEKKRAVFGKIDSEMDYCRQTVDKYKGFIRMMNSDDSIVGINGLSRSDLVRGITKCENRFQVLREKYKPAKHAMELAEKKFQDAWKKQKAITGAKTVRIVQLK